MCKSPLPWIAEAGDDNFAAVAESPSIPVLVDLWAPWCGPCRAVSPALENLARHYAGRLKLVKVNVDQAPRLSQRFGVLRIPTLLGYARVASSPVRPARRLSRHCAPGSIRP